jgi:glutamate-1-semialdehyde 2,1-aminomutase
MSTEVTHATLDIEYAQANPKSAALFRRQSDVIPSGITHSTRAFSPFPLFIERCDGARKWDVDGHEYIDYWLGHGTNLLGHGHPRVLEAIEQQLRRGFHAGGETELGCRWGELVCQLVPSADQVRFTSSGGEATQLALRVARAVTGRPKIVKFQHYYHGWHDAVGIGISPPWDSPYSPGIPAATLGETLAIPCNNLELLRETLEQNTDVAAVIVEPGGGYSDSVPIDPSFLAKLPTVTHEYGALLIFDEVVTGFRYATGGAQQYFKVLPDITTLGKVIGGGIPSGAVAGRADVMEALNEPSPGLEGRVVPQHGTWNANPLAAAAGVATLELVATGEPVQIASARADELRSGLNDLFSSLGLPAAAYGRASIWKTVFGDRPRILDGDFSNYVVEADQLHAGWGALETPLRQAMLLNGVDLMRGAGFTSSVHTEADVEQTINAYECAIGRLRESGILEA